MLSVEQIRRWMPEGRLAVPVTAPEAAPCDSVTEAAITGAALVRHLDDSRFATLRALRQLHKALGAERVAVGFVAAGGQGIREELVWAGGSARCGESERVIGCESFADEVAAWLGSRRIALNLDVETCLPLWHELACDHLLLVRGEGRLPDGGAPVLIVQLRRPPRYSIDADHAMGVLVNEYARRRPAAMPG